MSSSSQPQHVDAVRRFTRFYTKTLGVLHEGLLGSPFSLAESRVLYEIAHGEPTTAGALARELNLDQGYLSRILKGFDGRGLIARTPCETDGRQSVISLTEEGRGAFAAVNERSAKEVAAMLEPLPENDRTRLVEAMGVIETLLGERGDARQAPYILRPHEPGDIGWVVSRHGSLYAREYGWDDSFEAMVAEIAGGFLKTFDPAWERCWIAEKDGENVGCVFVVRQSEEVAKLRMLLVDPKARGLGIGRRLVEECIRFARARGYRRMTLWTNDILSAARELYRQAGFRLVETEPHRSFGHDLVGEYWALDL